MSALASAAAAAATADARVPAPETAAAAAAETRPGLPAPDEGGGEEEGESGLNCGRPKAATTRLTAERARGARADWRQPPRRIPPSARRRRRRRRLLGRRCSMAGGVEATSRSFCWE